MKKIIKYLIILFMFVFIPSASALTYNNLRVSAVFTGGKEVQNVDKIEVNYYTIVNNQKTKGKVTLLKSENFSTLFATTPIETVEFIYAIAITRDDVRDTYGFISYEPEVSEDSFGDYVDLSLLLIYNNKGFDGQKYRANSDITDEELNSIREGGSNRDTVVLSTDTGTPQTPRVKTTTTTIPTTTENPAQKQRRIIQDNQQKREEEKEERKKESLSLLVIILIALGVIIVLVALITIVKMGRANNRV